MQFTPGRTVAFAAMVCFVCSIFVAGAAVGLKSRQKANEVLDVQKKVLDVAGLLTEDLANDQEGIEQVYTKRVNPVLVDLKAGGCAGEDAKAFDQQKAMKDPTKSEQAANNPAKVLRRPFCAKAFQVVNEKNKNELDTLIIPVEGKGLWSTLYGFVALDKNKVDIKGLTFYKHAETPGLGGEVDNPKWKAQWKGKKAFKEGSTAPAIEVVKGMANDEYQVDGLSGATLTSRGVTFLLQYWLGDQGYGPHLDSLVNIKE